MPGDHAPAVAPGNSDPGPRARDVVDAALRGGVAAMAMTGMRAVTGGLDVVEQIPPQAIIRQRLPRSLRRVPRRRRDATIELAHWGYGAAGGALYGVLPATLRGKPWAGPAYGLVIWLGFEFGIAPALGLRQAPRRKRLASHAALAGDHLLYGLVLSEIRPAHKAMR